MSFFAIGVSHPKHEVNVGSLWRTAHAAGAAFVFTVGRRYREQPSDTSKASRSIPLLHFATLDDVHAHLPHACPLVGIELTDHATSLPAFNHPRAACYLLGAEDHGLTASDLAHCHRTVAIPGFGWCLNVSVAGSIVVYDRMTKLARMTERVAA